jgi:hypothetical protein
MAKGPEKPLFVPLNGRFIDDFEAGRKTEEFRPYGPRWNERTCRIGRAVVLSYGYGKARRLQGVITGFEAHLEPTLTEAWAACYGEKLRDRPDVRAACIRIGDLRPWTDPSGA